VVKKLERLEMAWFRFCTDSLFEWASPTQKQRLQSCFHEVIDYGGIEDALGAPARLYHRNVDFHSVSRISELRSQSIVAPVACSDDVILTLLCRDRRRALAVLAHAVQVVV
jgi:hypothetical protein